MFLESLKIWYLLNFWESIFTMVSIFCSKSWRVVIKVLFHALMRSLPGNDSAILSSVVWDLTIWYLPDSLNLKFCFLCPRNLISWLWILLLWLFLVLVLPIKPRNLLFETEFDSSWILVYFWKSIFLYLINWLILDSELIICEFLSESWGTYFLSSDFLVLTAWFWSFDFWNLFLNDLVSFYLS